MLWGSCNEERRRAESTASSPPIISGNVVAAAHYRSSVGLPLGRLSQLIHEALPQVALQYPSLGPANESKVHFLQLQDDPENAVDALVEQQQNLGSWQSHEQDWRVVIAYRPNEGAVSDVIVCFVLHGDSKDPFCGGLSFHRSFLAALSLADEAKPSTRQANHYSNLTIIRTLSKMPTSHTNTPASRSQIKTLTIGAEETTRLLTVPLRNKTNLTGVIQAALVAALFANLPSEITTIHAEGRISPQELQSLGGAMPDLNSMMCFTHHMTHTRQDLTTSAVWYEARHIHSTLKTELARKKSSNRHDLFRGEKDHIVDDMKDSAEEFDEISITVSNMGDFRNHKQFDSQQQQCWQLGKVVCGSDGTLQGADLSVSLVVGGDGCLTIAFAWSSSIVEGAWIDHVIATLRKVIGSLIHSNDTVKAKQVSDVLPWGGSMSRLVYLVRDLMLA